MPRFFCPQHLSVGTLIGLPEGVVRHAQVLRLKEGDSITLFNGEGGEHIATLTAVGRKAATAEVKTFFPRESELPFALTLAQALPEGSKMDWIVEKAVELGATALQPLSAQRCVVKLSGERSEKKCAHWNGIVIAASEQSGRNRLMHIAELTEFNQWIAQRDLHHRILLTPRSEQSLSEWARHHPPQAATLIVGPEGGFTEAEEQAACSRGALALTMGERILRTETAGLTALAALSAIWGGI